MNINNYYIIDTQSKLFTIFAKVNHLKMNIDQIQKNIIATFSFFKDWMERYEYLIHLGKSLEPMEKHYKIDENLIRGCQSKVWLYAEKKQDKIHFYADGEAILTKGIIALLLKVFNKQPAEEILKSDANFLNEIELKEHLSPTRANGLSAMVKQIKLYAMVLQMKNETTN